MACFFFSDKICKENPEFQRYVVWKMSILIAFSNYYGYSALILYQNLIGVSFNESDSSNLEYETTLMNSTFGKCLFTELHKPINIDTFYYIIS